MTASTSLLWAIWKERNRGIFHDIPLSVDRLKLSFISSLYSRVGLIANENFSLVRILCAFSRALFVEW